jgi:zeaxanthin glucosyltransferase
VRTLLVSPDYVSHYLPLSALGLALRARGHEVVIASGPALAPRVHEDGFDRLELVLGPGSNPGPARAAAQPAGERERLAAFFDATLEGMVATLRHQAESRLRDLLWRPAEVTARLDQILDEVEPELVVSDQLAFGATLALRALERPFVSLHPGHPAAIPGPGELFGFPSLRPRELPAPADELEALWTVCADVSDRFTREFNATLRELNPRAAGAVSALSVTSPLLTLLAYPAELGGHRRALLPRSARFVGACVRDDLPLGAELAHLLAAGGSRGGPRVYVSLGSFLSARSDLLRRIVSAFRREPVQLVLASGVTPQEELGELPGDWVVEPNLPQPALLHSCDLVVSHGGNNTVTEALWAGVPLLVCPLSTDQFAGAEDVRRAGLGDVFDPNRAAPAEIAARAYAILHSPAPRRAAALGARLRARAGPPFAARLAERAQAASSAPVPRCSATPRAGRLRPHGGSSPLSRSSA